MKTEKLPVIGLDRFKEHPEHVKYMDNDIAVLDSISEMLELNEDTVKLDCFMIVFCQEGNITVSINGQQFMLQKDYCAILPPGSILRKIMFNKPYTVRIAAASRTYLQEILSYSNETWDIIHYLYNNPIHPVRAEESYKMYLYKELLMTLIQEEPHIYSKQTRRYHFAGMFCEMMARLNKLIPDYQRMKVNRSRSSVIVREFIELVNADNGSHRSVAYYADRLCYSTKYLSCIVKQVTGKNPLQIINEHAIKEIKYKLKHSEMSMKEMADYFDFSNPSFFGKYVKAYIGISPLKYRCSETKEED